MKRFVIFLFLCFTVGSYAQFKSSNNVGYVFGVRIAPTWNGLITYFEAFYNGYKLEDVYVMSKAEFIARVQGQVRSNANPLDTNLFAYYQIENPRVIDSLWKLRYAVYPYKTFSRDTLGWTGNFANPSLPTSNQKQILWQMGMDTVYFTIFGENFFRLLQAMNDPIWIKKYKDAK